MQAFPKCYESFMNTIKINIYFLMNHTCMYCSYHDNCDNELIDCDNINYHTGLVCIFLSDESLFA